MDAFPKEPEQPQRCSLNEQPELCSAAAQEQTHSLVALAAVPDADLASRESVMRDLARDVRKTPRYIGPLPFLIYACLRQVRLHIFYVDRLVDIVAEYVRALLVRALPPDSAPTRRRVLQVHGLPARRRWPLEWCDGCDQTATSSEKITGS